MARPAEDGDTRSTAPSGSPARPPREMALTLARPGGQRRRAAAGSRSSTWRRATTGGRRCRHPGQPAQGQARHAQGAHGGAHARRRARHAGRRATATACGTSRRCSTSPAPGTRCAPIAGMRRGLALARDFARRRVAFGAPLSEKPLHVETLAEHAGRVRGRVPPHVPRGRAARPRGGGRHHRATRRACSADHAALQAHHRQAGGGR